MKKNIAKDKIKNGIPSIGTWVSSGNPLVCETLANTGIDWINIECEHSSIDLGDLIHCFRAVEHTDIPVFVRVAGSDPLIIKRVLDTGALGVVVPDIKNAEEAKRAIDACRYPPEGKRGIGATRPNAVYPDYMDHANEEICVVLMIEDIEAVNRIDSIMEVPGVDVIFIGPNDLAATLNVPLGMDNQHPKHVAAVETVLRAGKRHGIPTGIHCGSPEEISRRIAQGFLWMPIASDVALMRSAFVTSVAKIKETTESTGINSDGKFY
jgi:4-hydroxy-2-oxoheptanedioate aldolase